MLFGGNTSTGKRTTALVIFLTFCSNSSEGLAAMYIYEVIIRYKIIPCKMMMKKGFYVICFACKYFKLLF